MKLEICISTIGISERHLVDAPRPSSARVSTLTRTRASARSRHFKSAFRKFPIDSRDSFDRRQPIVKRLSQALRRARHAITLELRPRESSYNDNDNNDRIESRISDQRRGACSTRTRHEKCAARTIKRRNVSLCFRGLHSPRLLRAGNRKPQQ